MASPHVAGAAAVLRQANPNLTPDQVRLALQATATPVKAANGSALPFWEIGYGYVDLQAAVALVRSKTWAKDLTRAQSRADARVLADGYTVNRSDFWTYDAPRGTVAGTDSKTYAVAVPPTVTHLKVSLSHPSLAVVGFNGTSYTVTVRDAAGQLLGATTESLTEGAGTATAFIDLRSFHNPPVVYGAFTFEVAGVYTASDPDTLDSDSLLGRMVTLQVAQAIAGP
jgi:serine protease AprX